LRQLGIYKAVSGGRCCKTDREVTARKAGKYWKNMASKKLSEASVSSGELK
jgi:hypothetical protein